MNAPLECIIQKYEKSTVDWKKGMSGKRSVIFREQDFKETGKRDFMNQLMELEMEGLVKVKWYQYGIEAEKAWYSLEQMETIYQRLGKIPKFKRINKLKEEVDQQLALIQSQWIRSYYQSFLQSLDKGDVPKALDTPKRELLFTCFKAIDCLQEPVYKRIFSKKYLENTKTFEQEMQSHVISTAKKFCPDVEKEMDDTTVLQQLWIEEYAQELSLKGKLHFCLKEENGSTQEINTECYRFGTTLNSQTLEHAEIKEVQNIQKIVIFENKANYISAPYKDGILYLFSHGYFSPKECRFLKQLHQVLKNQTSCEVQYFHSGDLDYGGIKIFQYIRKTIFPELEPLQMDVETYEAYQEFTEVIDPETLEKLKRVQDENPKLQELIKRLIETGKGIEQECFLIEKRGNRT